MVVLLRKRVIQVEADAPTRGVGQAGRQRQTRISRRRVVTEGLNGEGDGDQAKGGFLPAHPIRAAVRRVTRHPVLKRRPEKFDMAFVPIAQPSADQSVGPGKAGELPDALDVIGARVTEPGPVLIRISRMPGEDAARPAIRATDLDQAMGENTRATAGESGRFRGRRAAGFDGPSVELRREVGTIEVRDRQARRGLTPMRRVKVLREILPWPHRRVPFPNSQPALARPTDATGEPTRTEVMEKGKEHWKARGLSR